MKLKIIILLILVGFCKILEAQSNFDNKKAPCLIDGTDPGFTYEKNANQVIVTNQLQIYGNASTIIWDMGDGTTFYDENTISYSYPSSGIYTITLTALSKDGTGNCCTEKISKTIKIAKIPPSNCAVLDVGFNYEVINNTINFNVDYELSPGTNLLSILWEFGDGSYATGSNPSHSFNSNIEIHYVCVTVFGKDLNNNNCSKKYCRKISTKITK